MEIIFWIGRILLGGYFILNGYDHFLKKDDLVAYAKMKKVPYPKLAVIVTGVMLLISGISILTGFFVFFGFWLMVLFLLAVSFMVHAFWNIPDNMAVRQSEKINFMKNLALVGCLLMMIAMMMY